ncbi:LysM domain-containing protein [Verminephrobacter aporrectodeae subsp. tuberculatae]|nr:LysM domain-containing protein [Verminephrobacter aporrectodeae subsp. tuberculatae]
MHQNMRMRNSMAAPGSVRYAVLGAVAILGAALLPMPAPAQTPPVSSGQRATAQQVAERGVALSELTPDAPDSYAVKRGDTLWGLAATFLKHPWRWPELWGMNLKAIPNPHQIFPGQTLYLEKDGGYARLQAGRAGEPETVRLSPQVRSERGANNALPTLKPHLIEPFLVEPMVIDAQVLQKAPRVVASTEGRVLMGSGDRVYARGDATAPLLNQVGAPRHYRVFRDAVALKDPVTAEILGYEAQYLGKAELVRGEFLEKTPDGKGGDTAEYVPATIVLSETKGDIQAGDRLWSAPVQGFTSYTPRAPDGEVDARVVSIYGNAALAYAAQNQVVTINRGTQNGIEPGHVLSLLSMGERVRDATDKDKPMIKLPSEVNGTAMVFRTFDRVSYALILEIRSAVRVGDRLVSPR